MALITIQNFMQSHHLSVSHYGVFSILWLWKTKYTSRLSGCLCHKILKWREISLSCLVEEAMSCVFLFLTCPMLTALGTSALVKIVDQLTYPPQVWGNVLPEEKRVLWKYFGYIHKDRLSHFSKNVLIFLARLTLNLTNMNSGVPT